MVLKSIRIENFRQFIDTNELEFSTDETRNVSIILGENGSGKTSLAAAFTWCLHGITSFEDRSMLNKVLETRMLPGAEEKVRVDVELVHGGSEYRISRVQKYKKRKGGKIAQLTPEFHVAQKVRGQQEFLKHPELEMKKILPKELVGYFFLDGEHIGKLTKELKKGKSKDFAMAVENLLGLKAFLEAIRHLKPGNRNTVIGQYNSQFDGDSNREVDSLSKKIQIIQEKIAEVEGRIPELENEIEIGEDRCLDLENQIRENERSTEYQKRKDELRESMKKNDSQLSREASILLKNFNNIGASFLRRSMVNDAIHLLVEEEVVDKGIPDIHEKTIQFLIERGSCICGTKFTVGDKIHDHLVEVINYIPPKSIGTLLNEFVARCGEMEKSAQVFFEQFQSNYSHLRTYEVENEKSQAEIDGIVETLEGMVDVGVIQNKLTIEKQAVDKFTDEKDDKLKLLGALEEELKEKEKARQHLAKQDEKNARIELYRAYAQEIYERLSNSYAEEEAKVRALLQKSINTIFRNVYEGGMSISIDEKYRIRVLVDEVKGYKSEIETSTAQSTSVIFAFIAGIIQLAKDFSNKADHELLAASEPYPLVLDAPLSNFDKRRIQTVCETLPKVAEQVIILIKDTDGEIAEQHLGSIIGKTYILENKSELETMVVSR
jgi:DNA sulfur modification protein DndD